MLMIALSKNTSSIKLGKGMDTPHLPSARIATSGTTTSGLAYVPPMLPILDTVRVPPANEHQHASV